MRIRRVLPMPLLRPRGLQDGISCWVGLVAPIAFYWRNYHFCCFNKTTGPKLIWFHLYPPKRSRLRHEIENVTMGKVRGKWEGRNMLGWLDGETSDDDDEVTLGGKSHSLQMNLSNTFMPAYRFIVDFISLCTSKHLQLSLLAIEWQLCPPIVQIFASISPSETGAWCWHRVRCPNPEPIMQICPG